MEIRNSDDVKEKVTEIASGKAQVTPAGIELSLPDAKGALADFKSANGTFISTSRMRLKSPSGREIELTYGGQ